MPSTQNKKLLIITYYWPPAGGPGVQRWLKFTKYLPEFGYDPIVLTVDEDQASYALKDETLFSEVGTGVEVFRTPTRELYSFYLKITGQKNIPFSGFVKETKPNFKEKIIRFLRTNLFIPDPRKGWNSYAYRKAHELITSEKIDHIITTGPPHSSHLIGLRLKKNIPSLKWVADFRDPWTHIIYFNDLNHSFLSRYFHHKLEGKVVKTADKVLVISSPMKNDFLTDHPANHENKILIIPNGYDEEDFSGERPKPDNDITITYTGTLAANYQIDAFINAIKTLNSSAKTPVKLRFVGEICAEYRAMLSTEIGAENLEIIPQVSHAQSINYLFKSHMLLLVIPNATGNEAILTGKMFEYLAVGKPIIGIGPEQGDAAMILNEMKAGSMFDYSKALEIKDYITLIKRQLEKGKFYHEKKSIEQYSRRNLAKQLLVAFDE